MFPSVDFAFYIEVRNGDLKFAVQKNIDKAYTCTIFSGTYGYQLKEGNFIIF